MPGEGWAAALVDASLRFGVIVALVELATCRARARAPRAVHRLWLLAAASAVVFAGAAILVRPVAFVHPSGPLAAFAPVSSPAWIGSAFLLVYGAGVCWHAARIVAGLAGVRELVRRASPLTSAEDLARLAASGCLLGPTRIVTSSEVAGPATVWWSVPVVLLPERWRSWPRGRAAAVLRHELAHVARHDYVWQLVAAVLHALLWFHPAMWLVRARLSLCAEFACDATARRGAPGDEYASHLLAVAEEQLPGFEPRWVVGAATRLSERVDALLVEDGAPAPPRRMRAATVVCIAALALLVAAAPVRVVPLRWTPAPPTGGFDHSLPRPFGHQHSH